MAANGGKNSPKQISQQVDELNKKLGVTQGKLEDINQTLTVTQAQSQKATQRIGKNLKDTNATLVSLQKEARAADARLARMVITGDAIRKSLVNGMTQSSTAMTTAAVSADRMNTHLHKTNMTTQDVVMNARRMTTAFQYAFALNPVTMFLRKMIEVRGEFEMQGVALQAILQNKDEADQLFNQITQLAVKSPFRVKDLLTYTKQLAAYRIENDQLYDTTKRLADVSAGLGVDMGRLILAYGQVKTANFLRASEVRQFTEAGVNMYGELARYFTEIEGKAVSTADVVERVSKRMVKFEDVAEVFRRMTNEGGIFYDMQEKQSYTVQGQIGKLKDSIDLMLNDIGTAQQGAIMSAVTGITDLLKHWNDVWFTLKTGIIMLGAYKAATTVAALATGQLTGMKRIDNTVTAVKNNLLQQEITGNTKVSAVMKKLKADREAYIASLEKQVTQEEVNNIVMEARIANMNSILTKEQQLKLSNLGLTADSEKRLIVGTSLLTQEQLESMRMMELTNNTERYAQKLERLIAQKEKQRIKNGQEIGQNEILLGQTKAREAKLKEFIATQDAHIVQIENDIAQKEREINTEHRRAAAYKGTGNRQKELQANAAARRLADEKQRLQTEKDIVSEKKKRAELALLLNQERQNVTEEKIQTLMSKLATAQNDRETASIKRKILAIKKLQAALVGLRALAGGLLFTGVIMGASYLIEKLTESSRAAKRLREELDEIESQSDTDALRMIQSYKKLSTAATDTTKTFDEQKDALASLHREFDDILPARLLDIEYIRQHADAAKEATNAIWEYARAQQRSKKIEAVINTKGATLSEETEGLALKLTEAINEQLGLSLKKGDILPMLDDLNQQVIDGVLPKEKYGEALKKKIMDAFNLKDADLEEEYVDYYTGAETRYSKIGGVLALQFENARDAAFDFKKSVEDITDDVSGFFDRGVEAAAENSRQRMGEWSTAFSNLGSDVKTVSEKAKKDIETAFTLSLSPQQMLPTMEDFLAGVDVNEVTKKWEAIVPPEMRLGNFQIDWDRMLNEAGYRDQIERMMQKANILKQIYDLMRQSARTANQAQKDAIENEIERLRQQFSELDMSNLQIGVKNIVNQWQNSHKQAQQSLQMTAKDFDDFLVRTGESTKDYIKRISTEYDNLSIKIKNTKNDKYLGDNKFDKGQLTSAEALLALLKSIIEAYADADKKTKSSGTKRTENLNSQISLIKELNSEYNKLLKNYDAETAKMKIMASYTDAVAASFKNINKKYKTNFSIADIDFTSEEGMAESLAKLREVAAKMGDDVKAALEKAISPFVAEVEVKPIVKNREQFKKQMDDILDDYNKSNEARSLGLSSSMASTVFGVNNTNTATMRKKLEQYADRYLRNDAGQFYGEEGRKEYEKWLEKINDMEDKAVQERMKNYVKYLNQSYTEVAAARVKLMQQFIEIDSLDVEDSVKEQMKAGAKGESDKAIGKAMWQQFKDSDMYVDLFADLENASTRSIDAMIEKLRGLGEEMKQLDPTHLKDIQTQIQKLEKVKMERSPLASLIDYYKQMRELQEQGHTEEFIDTQLDAKRTSLEEYINLQSQSQTLAAAAEQGVLEQVASQEELNMLSEMGLTTQADIAEYYRESANEAVTMQNIIKGDINQLKQEKGVYDGLRKTSKSFASNWKSVSNTMKSSWNEAFDVFEAVGGELTNEQKAYKEVGNAILDVIAIIPTYVAGMTAAGVAINSAMGIIGLIAEAISLTMGLIKALAGMNDAKQQDKIDDLSKKVCQLEQDFEDLEEAMEHAMNSTDYLKSYEDALDNIDERIQKTREMADAERAKKDTDEEKLQEYADNVRDLENEREELKQKLIEDWGGLGRDNWRSMAEDFVSAWMDAFEETGDGLEGLEKKFDEWLKNWFQKQATMKVASAMLEPLFRMIDEMTSEEHGLGLDTNELEQIRQRAAEIFPQLNESLKEMWEAFDMGGGAVDSLTGLQQGIEGITEATAEVIEGYLNSIRYFVAEDNAILIQIRDSIVGGVDGSGIADNVASMRNLLEQINNKLPDMTPFANQGGVMGLNVRIVE